MAVRRTPELIQLSLDSALVDASTLPDKKEQVIHPRDESDDPYRIYDRIRAEELRKRGYPTPRRQSLRTSGLHRLAPRVESLQREGI